MTDGLRSSKTRTAQILHSLSGADIMPQAGSEVDGLTELRICRTAYRGV